MSWCRDFFPYIKGLFQHWIKPQHCSQKVQFHTFYSYGYSALSPILGLFSLLFELLLLYLYNLLFPLSFPSLLFWALVELPARVSAVNTALPSPTWQSFAVLNPSSLWNNQAACSNLSFSFSPLIITHNSHLKLAHQYLTSITAAGMERARSHPLFACSLWALLKTMPVMLGNKHKWGK